MTADCPFCDSDDVEVVSPWGGPDDHQPDALPQLQHVLRGDPRANASEDQLRRRSVGAAAARSLLLTILGEFVLPRREPVWQETLVGALVVARLHPAGRAPGGGAQPRDGWLTARTTGPPRPDVAQ